MSWYIDKIIIDSREKLRGTRAFNYYNDYKVRIEPLTYGDYLFITNDEKEVVFEYKTCKDFINSMENKSLFNEISNQSMYYENSYLVITGDFMETFEELYFSVPHYRYKYKTIQSLQSKLSKQVNGALYRIYAMYIPIVFAENENNAFTQMLKISSKIADAKKYGGMTRPLPKKMFKENPATGFLTNVNGIGGVKARNITDELGIESLEDLCEKTPSDFLSVSRVTERNVCEIWDKIHNEELEL